MKYYTTFVDLIKRASDRYRTKELFSDFMEISAISFSNGILIPSLKLSPKAKVDTSTDSIINKNDIESREKRYLEIISKYDVGTQTLFPKMLAFLTLALDEELQTNGLTDVLGEVFHELGLQGEKGQFFTPSDISRVIGKISFDKDTLEKKGYIAVQDPAVGSGSLVLGWADAMLSEGINYQKHLLVFAKDIDLLCVHMAYVQFSLYNIPAVVIHGNTLTNEEWSKWYTPAYILNGWRNKGV